MAGAAQRQSEHSESVAAVGATIRKLRLKRGFSLRDLSRLTGFSIGYLSLVERGRSSPALTSLYKLAKALESDVSDFFQPDGEQQPLPHVARAGERADLELAGGNRTYRLLSGRAPDRVLEPILVTVRPTSTIEEAYSHEGEEFAYVLSGELLFVIGDREYRIGTDDSIHFHSTVPHSVHNDTGEPVRALWVLTPRLI